MGELMRQSYADNLSVLVNRRNRHDRHRPLAQVLSSRIHRMSYPVSIVHFMLWLCGHRVTGLGLLM